MLVSSGAGVTLANPGRQRARTIGATSGKPAAASCLTVSNSPAPLVSGSSSDRSWVLAVQSSAGVLVVADTARHVCTPITLGPTSQTPRYGRPVEHAGLVFVPDITTGEIIVLDPTNATTPLRGRIYVGLVGANLSLSSTQEFAWFADAQSDVVGVIDRDLVASLLHIGGSDDAGVVPARPDEASKPPPQTRIGCVPTPTQAAAGAPVQLDAFTSDPAVVATAWVWDTGGSPPTASGSQISVSWTTPGLKAVKVIATLPTGPTTSTCTVLVTEIGIAATTSAPPTTAAQGELKAQIAYSPVPAVAGEPVEFSDRSVGQHGTTTWTFEGGEPATSADRNPKVVFSKAGLHKVGLVVGDGTVTNTTSVDVAVRQAAATTTVGGAATTAAGGGGGGGATTSTSTTTSTTTPPTTPATGVPPRTTTTVAPSTTTTSTTIPTTTTTLPPWVPDAAWTISAYPYLDAGNGNPGDTETVASNGTIVAPQFSVLFAYPPPPAYGTVIRWNAVTRSSATRTRTLTYHFSGFMGFYHVTAFVTAIVWSPITGQITEFPLLALGPEDCGACNPPSGGFNFMGSFTFAVNAGDKYGFEFGGSDSTGNSNWNTSFSVTN